MDAGNRGRTTGGRDLRAMARLAACLVAAAACSGCEAGRTTVTDADVFDDRAPEAQAPEVPTSDAPTVETRDDARNGGGVDVPPGLGTFRFAVISDTHIIDEFYTGPESNALDSESIFRTTENLEHARDALAALPEPPDFVLVAGDVFHNYPSTDPAFYDTHETRIDRAAALMRSFPMPVHLAWGNHDYDEPSIPRELTHELLRQKFGAQPYASFDHEGWTFLLLDSMLGDVPADGTPGFDTSAALGREQLHWVEAQLARGRPTIVVLHHPLFTMAEQEGGEPGLPALLRRHADTVRMVFTGHLHMWIDDPDSMGVPHLVMSSARYDPDAYAVAEADGATREVRLLNGDCFTWLGFDTQPWDPVRGCTPMP